MRSFCTLRSLAFVCLLVVGACGRVAEPTATDDVDGGNGDAPARAVIAPPSDARVLDEDASALACANLPAAPARGAEDVGSPATYVAFGGGDERVFHRAYAVGAFAPRSDAGGGSSVCGDRGVRLRADICGFIELSACDDDGRSCIYLSSLLARKPQDFASQPAGHYVDETGRCWALIDAVVHLDTHPTSETPLGSSLSGSFEVTALSGANRRTLSGSFVTCLAVATFEHTCK